MSYKIGGAQNNSAPYDLNLDLQETFSWKTTPSKRPYFDPFPLNFAPYWPHFAPYLGCPGPLSLLHLWRIMSINDTCHNNIINISILLIKLQIWTRDQQCLVGSGKNCVGLSSFWASVQMIIKIYSNIRILSSEYWYSYLIHGNFEKWTLLEYSIILSEDF